MQIHKLNQSETMSMVNLGIYSIELSVIILRFQETEKSHYPNKKSSPIDLPYLTINLQPLIICMLSPDSGL